jgi:hypothetical protein
MARNLFLTVFVAALAGCNTPSQPPSASGNEEAIPVYAPSPVAPVSESPASVPTTKRLPLGPVRQK